MAPYTGRGRKYAEPNTNADNPSQSPSQDNNNNHSPVAASSPIPANHPIPSPTPAYYPNPSPIADSPDTTSPDASSASAVPAPPRPSPTTYFFSPGANPHYTHPALRNIPADYFTHALYWHPWLEGNVYQWVAPDWTAAVPFDDPLPEVAEVDLQPGVDEANTPPSVLAETERVGQMIHQMMEDILEDNEKDN